MSDAATFQRTFEHPVENSVASASLQSRSLQHLMQTILQSGRITTLDRQRLLQAGSSDFQLSAIELEQLRLIHDRLRMGLIKVIDS